MNKANIIGIVMLLLIILIVVPVKAEIYTGGVSGGYENLDVCGAYNSVFEIKATIILATNNSNYTQADDITATLINPDENAFKIISQNSIPIDSVNSQSSSPSELSWTINCNESNPGDYAFYILYNSSTLGIIGDSSQDDVYSHIRVHPKNVDIEILSPIEDKYYSEEPTLTITTGPKTNCTYEHDGTTYDFLAPYVAFGHEQGLTNLSEGKNTVLVTCTENGTYYGEKKVNFYYDTTPPNVTGRTNPISDELEVNYVQMRVSTNEKASCRISDKKDISYDNMTNEMIASTTKKVHKFDLVKIPEGITSYYIKCEDLSGNKMTEDYVTKLNVNLHASAIIKIDGYNEGDTISFGDYDVTLTSSEDLVETPTLTLSIGGTNKEIKLKKTDSMKIWKGQFKITEEGFDNVESTFVYKGKDIEDRWGDSITKGETIFVDTKAPTKVTGLNAKIEKSKVKLTWRDSTDTDLSEYKIYRSSTSTYDPEEVYAVSSSNLYLDSHVKPGKAYFYFVSAVDKSGNEGAISDYERIKINPDITPEPEKNESEEKNNLMQVTNDRIDKDLKEYKRLKTEYSSLLSDLNTKDSIEKEVLETMNLLTNFEDEIKVINSVTDDIKNIQKDDDKEARLTLDKLEEKITKGERNIVKNIKVIDERTSENKVNNDDFELTLKNSYSMLRSPKVKEKQKRKDLKAIQNLNKENIFRKGYTIEVTNYDDSIDYYTLVEEKSKAKEAKINIFFDNSVINNVEEITSDDISGKISNELFVSFKDDNISYIIGHKVKLTKLDYLKSVLTPIKQSTDLTTENNGITGFSITPVTNYVQNNGIIFGIIIIAALAGYYFFVLEKDNEDILDEDTTVRKRDFSFPKLNFQGSKSSNNEEAEKIQINQTQKQTNLVRPIQQIKRVNATQSHNKDMYESFNMLVSTFNKMIENNKGGLEKITEQKPSEKIEKTIPKKEESVYDNELEKISKVEDRWKELSKQMEKIKELGKDKN